MTLEQPRSWKPDRPVSKGATAYHDAVVNAPYYVENLQELVNIVRKRVKENDIVVDFGAGTGVSAIYLLKNIKLRFELWLVDNSAAWLGKAYEVFENNPNIKFFLLERIKDNYSTLAKVIGRGIADQVISANTIHLISDLEYTLKGINMALKPKCPFTFQSGNIFREGRKEGVLMVDDTVKRVHDIALDVVRNDNKFSKYREGLDQRISKEEKQRSFIFPEPRPLETYLKSLKDSGFRILETKYKIIRIKYSDWMNFLRVKRLQAGILPEIGGKDASEDEANDRDDLIRISASKLFKELEWSNPMADKESFATEWIFVTALKA